MLRCVIFSILFSFLAPAYLSQKFEFSSNEKDSQEPHVYLTDTKYDQSIDASAKIHREIFFIGTKPYLNMKLKFFCYSNVEDVEVRQVCYRKTLEDSKDCGPIMQYIFPFKKIKVIDDNPSKGFTILFEKSVREYKNKTAVEFSGLFSCNLEKNGKKIESNEFRLKDLTHQLRTKMVEGNTHNAIRVPPIKKTDMPKSFSCNDWSKDAGFDKITQMSDLRPYTYNLCKLKKSSNQMSCNYDSTPIDPSIGLINLEGKLMLHDSNVLASGENAIACKNADGYVFKTFVTDFKEEDKTFTKGLVLDEESPEQKSLEAISDSYKEVTLTQGSNLPGFRFSAIYKKPIKGQVDFEWKKDGQKLEGNNFDQNSFAFKRPVEFSDEGEYKLTVTSKDNAYDQLDFRFNLIVEGPPKFEEGCIPDVGYVISNEPLKIDCSAHKYAQYSVGIDGIESKEIYVINKGLNNLGPEDPRSKMVVHFNEGDSRKSLGLRVEKIPTELDLDIKIKAKNKLGEIVNSCTVKTIPFPESTSKPLSEFKCSNNCMNETVTLEYAIDEKVIEKLDSMNIKYEQDWIINDEIALSELEPEDEIFKFIEYSPEDPTKVTVLREADDTILDKVKIKTKKNLENLLAELLKDPNLQKLSISSKICYFIDAEDKTTMITPKLQGEQKIKKIDGNDYRLIYDSTQSSNRINLEAVRYFQQPPTQASFSWIAALVLGIVAFIIILVVACFLCRKKKKKTYTPRNEEIKHGMSPDDEFVDGRHLLPKEDVVFSQSNAAEIDIEDLNNQESDLKTPKN